MRHLLILSCFFLVFQSLEASAKAPSESLRPDARPVESASTSKPFVSIAQVAAKRMKLLRPRPRPLRAATPERVVLATTGAGVRVSARPDKRPRNLFQRLVRTSVRSQPSTAVATSKKGSVCGDRTIRGQNISRIPGRLSGCGIDNPVRVTSVDGVILTQPATINCDTAKALKHWVSNSVKPTVGRLGGGVKSLKVVAHYACRTRNNQPGAKISEHGRGNAIDIAAINLNNGVSLTVLKGWRDRTQAKVLKRVHGEACGTFGTVLGPNADRFHQDHFHLDVARHRGGAYCR